jgi:hypothetical protein
MFEVERSRGCLNILGWTRIFSNVFTSSVFFKCKREHEPEESCDDTSVLIG